MSKLHDWLYAPASNNLRVIAWVMVMTLLAILLIDLGKRLWAIRPDMKTATEWIAKAPTTNLRILNGISLASIFVLGTMIASLFGIDINETVLLYVGGFILVQEGLDVAQFGWKRGTFKPEAMGMTRESVEPNPPTPAAEVVATTGKPAVPPIPPKVDNVTITPPSPAPSPLPDLPAGATVVPDVPGQGD